MPKNSFVKFEDAVACVENAMATVASKDLKPITLFDETIQQKVEYTFPPLRWGILENEDGTFNPIMLDHLTREHYSYAALVNGWMVPDRNTGSGETRIPHEDVPVTNISGFDMFNFANWLSELFGFQPCYTIHSDHVDYNEEIWPSCRMPTETDFNRAIAGLPEQPNLLEHVACSENTGGQLQRIGRATAGPLKKWVSQHMHGLNRSKDPEDAGITFLGNAYVAIVANDTETK